MEALGYIEVVDHVLAQENVYVLSADLVFATSVDTLEGGIRLEALLLG
jgi:hypothetical protein